MSETIEVPSTVEKETLGDKLKKLNFEPMWQVILYNDDHHTQKEVFDTIKTIFNHDDIIIIKIISEIELNSKGIVEVEPKESAHKHSDELKRAHFTCHIEPIC